MAVRPEDILNSVTAWKGIANDEAGYRSCISRYYYAGYHAAIRFHGQLAYPGQSKANVGEHENLINKLFYPNAANSDSDNQLSKEISQYLKKVLFNRRLADYELNKQVTIKNVEISESQILLIFNPN